MHRWSIYLEHDKFWVCLHRVIGFESYPIVERQAQHRPDRLKKPRTGSVGTNRLGRVRKPVRRPVRRKAGSVQRIGRPLGKILCEEYILGVSVELFNEH